MTVDQEIVRVLKSNALFSNFTDTGIQILATVAQEKRVPSGAPLFVEHMIGDGLYIVAEGRIRLALRGPDGTVTPLALLGPGESLGEAALLRAGPRLCSATAEGDARVVEIARRDIAQLQRTKPQACLKLLMGVVETLGERLAATDEDFRAFVTWRAGG